MDVVDRASTVLPGAVELTVKNALSSFSPVAADAGPTSTPLKNVAPGDDTDDTSGTRDNSAA